MLKVLIILYHYYLIMDLTCLKKHQPYIIVAVLLVFMGIALLLRIIPAAFIKDPGFLYLFDTDSWYTMRQVEVMVKDFPQYNWFDPMTAYPTGKLIDWGPLYPGIVATVCLITGATTRSGIIFTSGWVSPLMAVVMVPVIYYLGKTVWNWKAGIIAAGLISVVSFQYFSLSSYGWTDHHIAEVLFSTLFFLSYSLTLSYLRSYPVDLQKRETLLYPVLFSGITGVVFFLALLSSTTVLLTLIVIVVYTIVQFILDNLSNLNSNSLVLINGVFLIVSIILILIFGFKAEGVSLSQYSIGIVHVQLTLIIGTIVLFILAKIFQGKRRAFLFSLFVLIIGSIVLIQIIPLFQTIVVQVLGLLFGPSVYSVAVVETLPWTVSGAWENFNFALILMAGGLLGLGYTVVNERKPQSVFLLIWSLVMLLLTIRFQRFAYFLTVNIVLLASICIAVTIMWRKDFFIEYGSKIVSKVYNSTDSSVNGDIVDSGKKTQSSKKEIKKIVKSTVKSQTNSNKFIKNGIVILVLVLTAGILVISISQDISYGISTPQHEISPDWIESLSWLDTNTPKIGIDYFKPYEARGFFYPPESYGIMAVWDAGHWITFFAHRIPITNPFQDNLVGGSGTAAYFLSQNESQANDILNTFGGKYVITNSDMAIDTFTNLVPWPNNSADISSYIKWFMLPDANNPSRLQKIHLYDNAYFQTMVARLHNFDGSMQIPNNAKYVQYVIRQVPAAGETAEDVNGYARVITNEQAQDISQVYNDTRIVREGTDLTPGQYTNIFSDLPNQTIQEISALKHYRLIHESPNNASVKIFPESDIIMLQDIKTIKIFEYVKSAHIPGNGIIELPMRTNTGRTFIYQQRSENGEFVVPYSTQGNRYDVSATGQYHILGTSRFITVTEEDIIMGKQISG
jgi:oligosaccharyl transferase (archaeosortase A-associated)